MKKISIELSKPDFFYILSFFEERVEELKQEAKDEDGREKEIIKEVIKNESRLINKLKKYEQN